VDKLVEAGETLVRDSKELREFRDSLGEPPPATIGSNQ
jgi:hypothetical protein